MKKTLSVILLVCMLCSMLSNGLVAFADEPAATAAQDGAAADAPATPDEPTQPAQPSAEELAAQEAARLAAEQTAAAERAAAEQTTAEQAAAEKAAAEQAAAEKAAAEKAEAEKADLGFWATETDDQLSEYNALLATLGYGALKRAGFATLCNEKGISDISGFEAWLENELDLAANAVASANGALYLTLDEALAAATASSRTAELTLLCDVSVPGFAVPDDKEVLLDLNGYTLALAGDAENPAYFIVCQNITDTDADGNPIYSHGTAHVKNGRIVSCPGAPDGIAVINAGTLTLANVAVDGSLATNADDGAASLIIEPGQFGENAYFSGKLLATPGTYFAISITGGYFAEDVSAYIDSALYTCSLNEQGIYAVAPKTAAPTQDIPAAGTVTAPADDKAAPATDPEPDESDLPTPIVSEDDAALSFKGAPTGFESATLTLTGLQAALNDDAMAQLLARYVETANAPAVAALAPAADTPVASGDDDGDAVNVRLYVKAELTAAEEGKIVTYHVKPYADINGVELPIENALLRDGAALTLSFYTGFCPAELLHDHQDGTSPEVIPNSDFTYNNGVVSVVISDFSAFIANATGGQTDHDTLAKAVTYAKAGDTITLSGDEEISTKITIDKSLTIDLDGKSITYTGTDPLFEVSVGATLTIIGKGTLDAGSAPIAKLNGSTTIYLGNDQPTQQPYTDDNLGTYNTSATAPFELDDSGQAVVRRAVTSFDPTAYVDSAAYKVYKTTTVTGTGTSTTTTTTYTVKLAPAARVGLALTGTEYETLKEALCKANTTDTVYLLRNVSEGDITLDKSLKLNATGGVGSTPWTLTGNITASGTGITPEIGNIAVVGNITANPGVTSLALTNVTLSSPDAVHATVSTGLGVTLTAAKLTCGAVDVAGDDAAATTRHNATLMNVTASTVAVGSNMNKVELLGVTADTVTVGDNITDIKLHSNAAESATSINALTIGANNKTVSIEHGTTNYPVEIASLTVGTGSTATLGSLNTTNSVTKLQIASVTSNGALIKINSGSYATLNGDKTNKSIALYGGTYTEIAGQTYPAYLEQYCACDLDADKVHYDHRIVTAGAAAGTWVVGSFEARVEVPASGMTAVTKGYSGTLTFITNIPYSHAAHGGAEPCLVGVTVDRSTISSVLPATDYTISNDNGRLAVTLNSGYLSKLPSGTYYIKIDSELGTAERMTDGTLAGFKINLTAASGTSGRLSGIIRTGDDANLTLLIGSMAAALVVAAVAVVVLKKKGRK